MMVETLIMLNKTHNLEDYHQMRSISISQQVDIKNTTSSPQIGVPEEKSRSNSMLKQDELIFFSSSQMQHESQNLWIHRHQDENQIFLYPPQNLTQVKSRNGSIHEKEMYNLQTPPSYRTDQIQQSQKQLMVKEDDKSRRNSYQQQMILKEENDDEESSRVEKNEFGKCSDIKIVLLSAEEQNENNTKNEDLNSDEKLKIELEEAINNNNFENVPNKENNITLIDLNKQNTNQIKSLLHPGQSQKVFLSLQDISSPIQMRPSEQPSFKQPLSDISSDDIEEVEDFRNSNEDQQ